jgi:hypothetical protein
VVTTGLDAGSWPSPLGSGANDRISPVPLSGKGEVRWRASLSSRHVTGVSVAASGRCFVTSEVGITALDGPAVRWEVETVALWGCVLLSDGLLVTAEAGGLVVREQATGSVVSVIEATALAAPMPIAGGLLVFLASRQRERVLRATTPTGEVRWETPVHALLYPPLVHHDRVLVTEGTTVRAFDGAGGPLWSAAQPGAVDGPLVGLSDGNVLVPVRGDDVIGYLVVDPRGEVRAVPAHLRPGPLVVPRPERNLLVLPGWPDADAHGESRPAVTVVDLDSGAVVLHHRVPAEARGMAAGATGAVAVAGSPTWDRWSKYQGWPGFDLRDDCYVLFLDQDGVRAEWKAGKPITGPLAVGADGDLLVPVIGELVSLA